MKTLTYMLLAMIGLAATSCDKRTDFSDPVSVKKAKERSEYILLCDTELLDGTLSYKMREVLYTKPGVKIPWSIGEAVPAPLFDASKSSSVPDRAVIFYEDFAGHVRPMETQLFYFSPPHDHASKLQELVTAIKP